MNGRRRLRFLLEVLFLAGVAAAATVAELRPLLVVGIMALAWLLVALFEWASWLGRPHYGRGLPPRYYVPQVALPAPRPVEQRSSAYPESAHVEDDATATWIVSAAEWATALDAWPVIEADPGSVVEERAVGEQTEIVPLRDPLPEFPPEIDLPVLRLPDAMGSLESLEGWAEDPAVDDAPVPTLPELTAIRPPDPSPIEAGGSDSTLASDTPAPPRSRPASEIRIATHSFDPLALAARRSWGKAGQKAPVIEVPDGPPVGRALPTRDPSRSRNRRPNDPA